VSADRLDRADSTAQIVLVGAVAMAFIIVGLVLVANTALYTESVGAEGSLGSADETGEFQRVARDATASSVYRVNERNNFSTRSALDTAVRDNVTALSDLLATEYGQEYGVFVDVEADLANSEYGARVEQDTFTFFNNSGSDTWTPVDSSTPVAEFDATFDVSEMTNQSLIAAGGQFYMRIEGNGGDERYISFYNQSGNLSISSDSSSPPLGSITPDCTVSTGDRVLVDVSNGSVPGTDCTFDGLDALEAPYTIEFNNGDEAVGTYSFVVADESLATDSKYADFGGGQPYSSFVYWEVNVDVTYEGSEVAYELTRDVPIYGDGTPVAPWLASPASVFFYDGSNVSVIDGNGSRVVSVATPTGAEALGPVTTDLTGDGRPDIPYVNSADEIVITNDSNATTTLATDADLPSSQIRSSKTRLFAGSWNGSPPSVFFVNENKDTIYRVAPGGSPQVVADSGTLDDDAQAVLGTGDIDGDGDEELLFADGSQEVQYIDPDGSKGEVPNGGVGSNNGVGSGSIADFDDDGTVVVVTVDGSGAIKLVGDSPPSGEGSEVLTADSEATKSPVTVADVDLDGENEIVYVGADDTKLKYVDDVRGSNTVKFLRDDDGDKIDAEDTTGVT